MIISVTQLNNFIKGVLDSETMLDKVSVKGEIINYKESNDSLYFSLQDGVSQLDCFCYRDTAKNYFLTNGLEVVLNGRVNYLTKFGKLSFTVTKITLSSALGAQYQQLLMLKERLQKDGCFSPEIKKKVKRNCLSIGVVTSPTGAVIHDIEQIVLRRNPLAELTLYPVKVQGEGADKEIADGIKYFSDNGGVDVVIIARGGGSKVDLSSFNTERVVRAVNACVIPTVSAVGHEIDFTLCDFAADARTATPSEAAEMVTIDVAEYQKLAYNRLEKMSAICQNKASRMKDKVSLVLSRTYMTCSQVINTTESRLNQITTRIDSANPSKLLSRGFVNVYKDNDLVKSLTQVKLYDKVKITFIDGEAQADITQITKR